MYIWKQSNRLGQRPGKSEPNNKTDGRDTGEAAEERKSIDAKVLTVREPTGLKATKQILAAGPRDSHASPSS